MAGQPPKFTTAEAMQKRIDLYFLTCKAHQQDDPDLLFGLSDEELLVVNGIDDVYPSVTGLALALGFCERKSLIDTPQRMNSYTQ